MVDGDEYGINDPYYEVVVSVVKLCADDSNK